jgi:nicotinamide mononucleotide transporter
MDILEWWSWAQAPIPGRWLQAIEPGASPLEIVAVALGLICVWCYVRENMWAWPTGLLQPLLFAAVFYGAHLYADFGLQIVFAVVQVYGWWRWLHRDRGGHELAITRTSATHWGALAIFAVIAYPDMAWLIQQYCVDASMPWWDSAETVLSLVAQWLISHKKLENWLVWIVVDISSIPLYWIKGLHLTAGLYLVFLVLATLGFLAWRRTHLRNPAPLAELLQGQA